MTVPLTPFKQILVPTDFSPFSVFALRHGLALAHRFKARLKVAHVVPRLFPSGEADYLAAPWLMTPQTRQRIEEEMRGFLAPAREARIGHETEICEGDPWREIVRLAEEMPADLVVMGTHGRGGLEHLLLGSVAEKLVRRLPCPVLTVGHEEGRTWEAPGLITRVVCAIDFSEISSEALRAAMSLADASGSEVTLLHVVEGAPDFGDLTFVTLPYAGPLRRDLEEAARNRLEKMIEEASGGPVRITPRVVSGRAYKEILRVATEERADLLVVGAQGHGVIEHLLSGSNAQHVIRRATCPVLTVRPLQTSPHRGTRAAALALASHPSEAQ